MDERVLALIEALARGERSVGSLSAEASRLLYSEPDYLGTYTHEEEVLLSILHGLYRREAEE